MAPNPVTLLKVAQGPLLSSAAYSRAVEAVVSAAKGGFEGSEWRDATVRLLQSRSNSPLALLWAFLAFQKRVLESESSSSPISVAQSLLHSLKFVTAGFCNGPTAIAAAAPIVQILVSAIKAAKTKKLPKFLLELSGYIALCHHKAAPVTHGLFKAPSVNIGLDIWLSGESDFAQLFPFASQLKVDGFLNSIESVLFLGETVETEVALLRLVVDIKQGGASEKKLKHDVILYSKFLASSSIILDMLLDAPLELGGTVNEKEDVLLRTVLSEMAVVVVPNSELFDIEPLSAGDTSGKDCVAFLKRVILARQLAAEFRSKNEYLRASELLAGLHRRGPPGSLGEWLGDRSSLRLLISTAVLEKPQALVEWLLNASNADFNAVLDKAYIARPKTTLEDSSSMEFEENESSSLFFIDTSKDAEAVGFDADQAYLRAAGDMQDATKDDILFDRAEQLERKRTRGKAAKSVAKQRKDANGAKMNEDISDSEMSEDESEVDSETSE